jgi:hypothetical protein
LNYCVIPGRVEDANYGAQLRTGESRGCHVEIPGSMLRIAPE